MKIAKDVLQGWADNPQNIKKLVVFGAEQITATPFLEEGWVVLPTDLDGNFVPHIMPQIVKKVVDKTNDGSVLVHLETAITGDVVTDDAGHFSGVLPFSDRYGSCVVLKWASCKTTHDNMVRMNHSTAWFVGCVTYPKDVPHSLHQTLVDHIAGYDGCFVVGTENRFPLDRLLPCVEITHRYGGKITIQRMLNVMEDAKRIITDVVSPVCNFAQQDFCAPIGCYRCDHFINKPTLSVF